MLAKRPSNRADKKHGGTATGGPRGRRLPL